MMYPPISKKTYWTPPKSPNTSKMLYESLMIKFVVRLWSNHISIRISDSVPGTFFSVLNYHSVLGVSKS